MYEPWQEAVVLKLREEEDPPVINFFFCRRLAAGTHVLRTWVVQSKRRVLQQVLHRLKLHSLLALFPQSLHALIKPLWSPSWSSESSSTSVCDSSCHFFKPQKPILCKLLVLRSLSSSSSSWWWRSEEMRGGCGGGAAKMMSWRFNMLMSGPLRLVASGRCEMWMWLLWIEIDSI